MNSTGRTAGCLTFQEHTSPPERFQLQFAHDNWVLWNVEVPMAQKPLFGPQHRDQGRFASILRRHGIIALNTWSAALGPPYVHDHAASRIDYMCTRRFASDGPSHQVLYLWNAPFMPVRQQGHEPPCGHVLASECTTNQTWGDLTPA